MLFRSYGRGSSKSAILKKKRDMSPIAFDMNYGGNWVGSSTGALVNINRLMNCRTLTEPETSAASSEDEYYIGGSHRGYPLSERRSAVSSHGG